MFVLGFVVVVSFLLNLKNSQDCQTKRRKPLRIGYGWSWMASLACLVVVSSSPALRTLGLREGKFQSWVQRQPKLLMETLSLKRNILKPVLFISCCMGSYTNINSLKQYLLSHSSCRSGKLSLLHSFLGCLISPILKMTYGDWGDISASKELILNSEDLSTDSPYLHKSGVWW